MKSLLIAGAIVLSPAAAPDYVRDVKPLIAKHCTGCHGSDKQRASLRLDSAAGMRKGGNSGPAIVPGDSAASLLIKAIIGADRIAAMPPKGPRLDAAEVAILRAWIDAGAPAPTSEVVSDLTATKHWAFRPVVRPPLPTVTDITWAKNPIDRFILSRLERERIRPSPEADRITLFRRVSLDLTGLPPSPQEVDAFLADRSADAYEKAVDRLLASPHYGERRARHWLDLARYADSNGYSIDAPRSIWKYRDWVINAFNDNLPFDRFVIEQIAGDLLPGQTLEQRIATGFHRNTPINQEGGIDLEQFRVEAVVDRVNTTGSVFLGLTIGCCQCHDHKFDPLSQREYYRLFAFFNNSDDPTIDLGTEEQIRKRNRVRAEIARIEKRLKTLDRATPEAVEKWEGSLTPESRAKLPAAIQHILTIAINGREPQQVEALLTTFRRTEQVSHAVAGLGQPLPFAAAAHAFALDARLTMERQLSSLRSEMPDVPTTLVVNERKQPRETYVMLGGDFLRKGASVPPGTPAVLPSMPQKAAPNRLDLARWLVDPGNPLTARVAVNRFWQDYFGLGIVETDNDFGTRGTPPSHPELLDWLASEFVRTGWDIKAMQRLIVTSTTYRQSSRARSDLATLDPRNRLLARQSRLRLDAEVVRDVALAASGLLNPKVGGPSVFPPQPAGVYAFTQVPRTWKANTGRDRYRRGMYTWFWRTAPHPGLTVFDAPDASTACTRRNRSNTPLQALTLLNDQGFYELAQGLACRILKDGGADDFERIAFAFRVCLARPPKTSETETLARLLQRQNASADAPVTWTTIARVLFNLDEFITRE
jgi:mono/diheme cytochrome c family protein